jgi:hypothetical protein
MKIKKNSMKNFAEPLFITNPLAIEKFIKQVNSRKKYSKQKLKNFEYISRIMK